MEVRAGRFGERDVAGDHYLFGGSGCTAQPKAARDPALVHHAARRERWVLAVIDDRRTEHAHVLQRAAHEVWVGDRRAIVAESDRAGIGADFGDAAVRNHDIGDGVDDVRWVDYVSAAYGQTCRHATCLLAPNS